MNNKDLTINELTVELHKQKNDLTSEVNNLKSQCNELKIEVERSKLEVENANKRNLMLQYYLVAANETIPEDLYVEKVK